MPARLKTIQFLLFAAGLSLLAACSKVSESETPAPAGAVLRLSTQNLLTRGDGHYGDDPYAEGEEAIRRVDLFFFTDEESTDLPFFTFEQTSLTYVTVADMTVKIPVERIADFQANGKKAYVYALVNLPENIKLEKNYFGGSPATLKNLRELWVDDEEFVAAEVPGSFVMRGGNLVNLLDEEGKMAMASGTVLLERLAAKIRLWADIPEAIYLDVNGKTITRQEGENEADWNARVAETWKPVPVTEQNNVTTSNLKLYLNNIARRGRIDAHTGTYAERDGADGGILRYGHVNRNQNAASARLMYASEEGLNPADIDPKYPYTHAKAYYSYPNQWDSQIASDQHRTYVILSLPWMRQELDEDGNETGGDFQVCYYQIPVNALRGTANQKVQEADRLDPNRYYRIKIHLGMLGSKDLGNPLEIDASCEVVDWTAAEVGVSIRDRRYLVVNQKNWTMNNVYTIEIPFSSSHKAKIEACYVNYFRYNDAWGTDNFSKDGGDLGGAKRETNQEFSAWLDAADDQLRTKGGRNGEGLLKDVSFDGKSGDVLYYKKEYFYDRYYAKPDMGGDGFVYYVGHEHPKTFKDAIKGYNNGEGMTAADKELWEIYKSKYDQLDSVYSCTIDNGKGVIRFSHPLIQWEEVRADRAKGTGELKYYVPLEHKRLKKQLWEEYSRCEVVIKIRHEDWEEGDGLYEETVYITQYPGMYIEVSHDYGRNSNDSKATGDQSTFNEYVIVNGNNSQENTGGGWDWWNPSNVAWYEVCKDQVAYFYGANNNPNMYVIYTTQLSEENENMFDLGDPRSLYYNNMLSGNKLTHTANTSAGGVPTRWSNKNITNGLSRNRDGRQTANNSEGPGWWLSRDYKVDPGYLGAVQVSASYTYSGYDLVNSLYPAFKPDNDNPEGTNSDADVIWVGLVATLNHQDWSYVNHKNNLCYYYPTDELTAGEAGSKANFIAPAFRIASSFGKVTQNTKENARRRCATYQEAGRPAGRWRLPTLAEIKYIAQLSADGKIPVLFGNTDKPNDYGYYWCANGDNNGKVEVNAFGDVRTGTQSDSYYSPRCVYDEWYWTEIDKEIADKFTIDPLSKTFLWGDRPKDNTQTRTLLRKMTDKQAIVADDE